MIRTVQAIDFHQRKFLTDKEVQIMIKKCNSIKDEFLITFLADTGARVTEALMCKVEYMNVFKKEVLIPTLKQGKDVIELRIIAMSDRLKEIYVKYWQSLEHRKNEDWIFPSPAIKGERLTRQAVDLKVKTIAKSAKIDITVSAHKFRHSFGTRLAEKGTPMNMIQKLMGHQRLENTLIYTHMTGEWRQLAIKNISTDTWLTKVRRKIFGIQAVGMLPSSIIENDLLIGRNDEVAFLQEMGEKKQNVLLIGKAGTGKSKILNNYAQGKVLRLQDLKGGNKKVLGNILLHLFNGDKNAILKMLYSDDMDAKTFGKKLDKEKEVELMLLIKKVTKQNEYTVIIDDLDQITKTTALLVEKMKEHFHIIAAAREVKIDYEHTFSNFRLHEVKTFNRPQTSALIDYLTKSYKIHIREFDVLKNHVFNETGGNPQYITEMIRTYEAEGGFDIKTILNIKHTAGRKVIDFTPILVLCFCGLMILRYLGSEMGEDAGAFRFIGGSVMVIALFARQFVNLGKRKILSGY